MADQAATASQPREVSPEDKRLAADWLKRIDAALKRHAAAFKNFERNRVLLRGHYPEEQSKKFRTNLFAANLFSTRPQVYAKDPEFTVTPKEGVSKEQLPAMTAFAEACEILLTEKLVRGCRLKQRAKRQLTSAYSTCVGWLKLSWQEDNEQDVLQQNELKSLQDNLVQLEEQRKTLDDPQACKDQDLQMARIRETIAGMEGKTQAEAVISRGLVLDFVLSEDLLVIDPSVLELGDYQRSEALGHRVYLTREQYKARFGYECAKGKGYTERAGQRVQQDAQADKKTELLCVWEVWDQSSNRVLWVCEGEEGFCMPSITPDWTGRRWYPFFALSFNEIDGTFYPQSDVELSEQLVREYNEARDDLVKDRRDARPFTVVRGGGSLTDADIKAIRNREGNDVIVVKGVGNTPLSADMQAVTLGQINPALYDTAPARQDLEQLLGGGDASRGSVLKAKTATEAEILSQGLRSRSAERQDTMEDVLSDMGEYALQAMMRKMTPEEVQAIAGPDAPWPQLSAEEVFSQLMVRVRGGSTGKPDRLQEQDRWTQLMPVIKETMQQVAELRTQGQEPLAQALIALLRETLRRFDERLDLDQFLPPPEEGEEAQPAQDPAQQQAMQRAQQLVQELQAALAEAQQALKDKAAEIEADVQKAEIDAAARVQAAVKTAEISAEATVEVAKINTAGRVQGQIAAAELRPDPEPPAQTGNQE
jgi:hypothetical protein